MEERPGAAGSYRIWGWLKAVGGVLLTRPATVVHAHHRPPANRLQYTVIVVKGHEGSKKALMGRYVNEGQTYNNQPIFVKRAEGKG